MSLGIDAVLDSLDEPVSPPQGRRAPRAMLNIAITKPARKKREPKAIDIDEHGAPVFSDIAIASAFAASAVLDYRWSPGLEWVTFDGNRWVRDDTRQRVTLMKGVVTRYATLAESDGDARRMASAKTVQAALTMAQADPALVVNADVWDSDHMALNTPGGLVNLATGTMRPRGMDYVTQVTGVTPNFKADCHLWHKFLRDVFVTDDLIDFMRLAMGYMLTGSRREQVLFFWYGLGANGKSLLAAVLQRILGSYSLKLPATALMQSKGERHPTELAQLRGKRLAISSELDENSYFNESLIKELTGDDTLTARFMRGDFFEFPLTQKNVIVGNFKPRLRGGDAAMARRMLLVPFNATFKGDARDPHLLDKLMAEAPAILAWLIGGAIDWHSEGLKVPASVREASAEYMNDHDDLAMWLDECCERQGEARAADLYSSFARWKKNRGEHAPSQTVWGSRLTTLAGIEKRRSNGIRYAGVRLTEREQLFLSNVGG